ncbi:MAG: FAD:protein FMN transferase [Flavobacteriaceae bacterium]
MWSISVVLKKFYSLALLLILFSCQSKLNSEVQRFSGFALGTSYAITYVSSAVKIEVIQREVDSIVEVMNASMSTYIPDSDISKINNGDSLLQVDSHFEKVYHKATVVWKKTEGYFDPTVGALVNAYGFGPKANLNHVSKNERDQILKYTGWNKTRLTSKKTIQKEHPQLFFDFNALAKGYAVDLIAELLRSKGIDSFLVEVGGEIVAQGLSPKSNAAWKVAIDDPKQGEERRFIKVISLTNQALATSGNYRKYKVDTLTGKRLVHSINPKTGNSFASDVLSASVLAPNCMTADAFATALMVMPFEQGKVLIERETDLEAYWIIQDSLEGIKEVFSKGFGKN